MGFHERVETELLRGAHQPCGRRIVEVAEDEQRGVSARLPQLAQVLRRREEALGEQRHVGRRPRRAQVVERAGEGGVHEDGDGPRSSRSYAGTTSSTRAPGLMSPTDGERRLNSAIAPKPGAESASANLTSAENSTSSSSRAAAAPESIASRACAMPSRRLSAWPAAAIPPAALRITADR